MDLRTQLTRLQNIYHEYPSQFWILILGMFIDRVGGALLFPFFSLYITHKFGVGMTTVGIVFGIFSISSVVGNTLGGALADHIGRKGMVLFGLVASATSSLLMGSVDSLDLFMIIAVFVGTLSDIGHPATQAMVADLLSEEQRADGFGLLRVVANLAVAIGPAIGGLLAARSYLLLFVCDAITSLITAGIVLLILRETRPPRLSQAAERPSFLQTFGGYGVVLRDLAFVSFMAACMLMTIAYIQMYSTLSVYLRDVHDIPEQGFGYIISLNAAMVVLFQFAITRRLKGRPPLLMMMAGSLLYAFGLSMYGWSSSYSYFVIAMVIITLGEMIAVPVTQAFVARLAPPDMRGRYMAVFGLAWIIPSAIGPLLAGLIMDNISPNWVWYAAGLLGLVAAGAFATLQRWTDERVRAAEAAEASA